MTASIKTLTDQSGNIVYPQTKSSAVFGTSGQSIQVEVDNALASKSNKYVTIATTLNSSGWSNDIYSFESTYPTSNYDVKVELNGDSAGSEQIAAWSSAKIIGSASANKCYAKGTVPTINLPIILTYVQK